MYTKVKLTPVDIILLNLLEDYEKVTGDKKPALLDTKTIAVGLSFKAPHKLCLNVFQILYVKQNSNTVV